MQLVDAADGLAWLGELMEQVVQIGGDLVMLYFVRDQDVIQQYTLSGTEVEYLPFIAFAYDLEFMVPMNIKSHVYHQHQCHGS